MIKDNSRKIQTMIFHLYGYEEFKINVAYIARLSTRSEIQVKEAVNDLIINKLLQWDKKTDIYKLLPPPREVKSNRYYDWS